MAFITKKWFKIGLRKTIFTRYFDKINSWIYVENSGIIVDLRGKPREFRGKTFPEISGITASIC